MIHVTLCLKSSRHVTYFVLVLVLVGVISLDRHGQTPSDCRRSLWQKTYGRTMMSVQCVIDDAQSFFVN